MKHCDRRVVVAGLLAVLSCVPAAFADNLIRGSSFESVARDTLFLGYNRYSAVRSEVPLRLVDSPIEVEDVVDAEMEELLGGIEAPRPKRGWRMVKGKNLAHHGQVCMATELPEDLTWATELGIVGGVTDQEAAYHTFSFWARTVGERELLKLTVEDIRGRKGEIRNRQYESYTLTKSWKRYTWSGVIERGPVTFSLRMLGAGRTVYVDAVQLEPGKEATAYAPHPYDLPQPGKAKLAMPALGPRRITAAQQIDAAMLAGIVEPTSALPPPTAERRIPLRVVAPLPDLPVSGGIPIRRGEVFDPAHMQVVGSDGKPVVAQIQVLSRHVLDSSIQMVLIDMIAETPDSHYQLTYAPSASAAAPAQSPLTHTATPDRITVNTGPLQFEVRTKSFNLFESLSCDLNGDGEFSDAERLIVPRKQSGAWTADAVGEMHWSSLGEVESVVVEEAGPIRIAIAAKGTHHGPRGQVLFQYAVRIHAYAGKPYVRIEHTFINAQGPFGTVMNGAGVRLALNPAEFKRVRFADDLELPVPPKGSAYLVAPNIVRTWSGSETKSMSVNGPGWVTTRGDRAAVTATIRQWHWMPYKEFYFSPETGLDLCVWPRHMTQGFTAPTGLSRSHRFWVHFHKADQSPEAAAAHRKIFNADLLVQADPAWYCDSEVFGHLAVREPERFPQFEEMLARFPDEETYRWHDFIHYGDDRGDMGFGNMETMIDHSLFLQYVRSRDPWYFRRAYDAVEHYRDVDVVHPLGQARVHSHNHTIWPWDGSHQWIKGILDHYLLTGDRRSLDVAHEMGRWIRTLAPDYQVAAGTRRFTRLVQNLADLYRFTGHREYRDNFIARLDVAEQMRGERRDVSRFNLSVLSDPMGNANSFGRTGFMQWYGMAGVGEMMRATGDQRMKDVFVEELGFLLNMKPQEHTPPKTDADFRALGSVIGRNMIENDTRNRVLFPYIRDYAQLTGEPRYLDTMKHAAIFAITDTRGRLAYGNIGSAGLVMFAYGLFEPQRAGMTAQDEAAIIGTIRTNVLPSLLRDPDFEQFEGSSFSAWATGHERVNLALFAEGAKDTEIFIQGKGSLRIGEKEKVDILERRKRLLTPMSLSAQSVHLDEVGVYQLTGFVRFDGHARPDVVLNIDGDSGKGRVFTLDLVNLLPKPRYKDLDLNAPQVDDVKEDVSLDDPNRSDDGKWWQFNAAFPLAEPSTVIINLQYHIGQKPPGTIWFDGFNLQKVDRQIDQDIATAELIEQP